MASDEKESPAVMVAIVLAGLALAAALLSGVFGEKEVPTPVPSPSMSQVAYTDDDDDIFTLCVQLMVDNDMPPELCEPIEPREEDTARDWSCRMDGNRLCGADDRWTWGIGLYA